MSSISPEQELKKKFPSICRSWKYTPPVAQSIVKLFFDKILIWSIFAYYMMVRMKAILKLVADLDTSAYVL